MPLDKILRTIIPSTKVLKIISESDVDWQEIIGTEESYFNSFQGNPRSVSRSPSARPWILCTLSSYANAICAHAPTKLGIYDLTSLSQSK